MRENAFSEKEGASEERGEGGTQLVYTTGGGRKSFLILLQRMFGTLPSINDNFGKAKTAFCAIAERKEKKKKGVSVYKGTAFQEAKKRRRGGRGRKVSIFWGVIPFFGEKRERKCLSTRRRGKGNYSFPKKKLPATGEK